jgi:hypothetical protein
MRRHEQQTLDGSHLRPADTGRRERVATLKRDRSRLQVSRGFKGRPGIVRLK